jgi:hypothetical protein
MLQPLVDSSPTNTPIVSRQLTARTASAPIFLTTSGYCRPSAPASSCDRHVRIAAYTTARRPSGVQQKTAAASGMSISTFFVLSYTARQLQAHCCAISHRRPMRRESWAGEASWHPPQNSTPAATAHTHTHTHTNPPSASSHATILCCQLLTDSGYLHAGCGSRLARPTSYARLKHALVLAQGTPVALFQGSKSTDPPMQHIASRAADLRTIMPRHGNPKELTINLTAEDDRNAPRDRPNSSPIALEGVDLSSIDGGIGHASLPASPPASSSSPRKTSTSKSILSTFKNRSREASRERSRERALQEQQDSKDQARCMQEQEGHVPETGSMSKVYHLRKAPGSTPELSLVSSAESVAKGQNEGTQKAVITCFQMTYERWRAQGGM